MMNSIQNPTENYLSSMPTSRNSIYVFSANKDK